MPPALAFSSLCSVYNPFPVWSPDSALPSPVPFHVSVTGRALGALLSYGCHSAGWMSSNVEEKEGGLSPDVGYQRTSLKDCTCF